MVSVGLKKVAVMLFGPFIVISTVSGVAGASGLTTGSPVQFTKPYPAASAALQETTVSRSVSSYQPSVAEGVRVTEPPPEGDTCAVRRYWVFHVQVIVEFGDDVDGMV
jgi:hypothetical protein